MDDSQEIMAHLLPHFENQYQLVTAVDGEENGKGN
jgi:hypothetical protein